jgi:hypothetical protein
VSVSNNTHGGILLDNAAFEIRDTTVNGNGPNTAFTVVFGGIGIQNTPATGPRTLSRSTINNNEQIGVSCGTGAAVSPAPTDVLASGSGGGVEVGDSCGFTECTVASTTCGAQP